MFRFDCSIGVKTLNRNNMQETSLLQRVRSLQFSEPLTIYQKKLQCQKWKCKHEQVGFYATIKTAEKANNLCTYKYVSSRGRLSQSKHVRIIRIEKKTV